ncbi:phosphopantetheine-binding protein [Streptomyces toxytricini]|uniref:Phosphopantetheine-binding protein n=1 Tax=Streptomyces toxytricini TaxID=67369 RepID=A0ABW8EHN6_STRT5
MTNSPAAPGTAAAAVPDAGPQDVTAALARITAGVMKVEPEDLAPDANLVHCGLGSLEIMRVVGALRRAGIAAGVRELATEPTLEAWTRHLLEGQSAAEVTARLA